MTTWHPTTPPWYVETATRVCTPKQLEVLRLASHPIADSPHRAPRYPSNRQLGNMLNVSRETIRGHREAAHRRIKRELERTAA